MFALDVISVHLSRGFGRGAVLVTGIMNGTQRDLNQSATFAYVQQRLISIPGPYKGSSDELFVRGRFWVDAQSNSNVQILTGGVS